MSYYNPDNWVVIRIKGDDPHYKVLAGWSGSYAYGDSWRMNSGVTRVEKGSTSWKFYGHSGSIYECGFHNYGLRYNNIGVWHDLQKAHGDIVEIMDANTNWLDMDWVLECQ